MISENTLGDGIGNQTIHEYNQLEEVFMIKQRLRWFGHMERMDNKRTSAKAKKFVGDGLKKDRPKKISKKVKENNIRVRDFKRTNEQDCFLWKLGCKN